MGNGELDRREFGLNRMRWHKTYFETLGRLDLLTTLHLDFWRCMKGVEIGECVDEWWVGDEVLR